MKRNLIVTIFAMLVVILAIGVSPAMAGEPQDVIEKSSSYPSGPHFNLNIHEKDPLTFSCKEVLPGRKSTFIIDEYGESAIQYITNKKSTVTDLIVLKPCAGCFNDPPDDTPAKVMLPYEEEGFYVYARSRAKSNKEQNDGDSSSIILYPNLVVEACNDTGPASPDFPVYLECPDDPQLTLGLSNIRDVYNASPEGFVRFDPATSKGKEMAKPVDIMRPFKWAGWVWEASIVDTNEDGNIDAYGFTFVRIY